MTGIRNALLVGLAVAGVVVIPSAPAADDSAVKKDLAQMQGAWSMISGSADGQTMPAQTVAQMKRVCTGDEVTVTMAGQVYLKGKFAINPSTMPKTIDYQMTDGFTKGKKQLGIYELQGDTFKSCFSSPGAERPTDFTSKPGDGRTLSVWQREKKERL